jgi:anti-sigma regulatory factor (Ser/Thr protein kinase)
MNEIALHIFDIAENSIAAGADRVLISIVDEEGTTLRTIRVEDNGKGMSKEQMIHASDPFYTSRTTRRVGLGLPLFRQHAEMTGGGMTIHSEEGTGTVVQAVFDMVHPDCQPMGDLEGTWLLLVISNPEIEWELLCRSGEEEFFISSSQIRRELDVDVIRGNELTTDLKRMIRNNLDTLEIH